MDRNKLWKILQEIDYQTILTVSWETCRQIKKQQWELDMDNVMVKNWEKNTSRLYIVTLFINLHAEYIMWNDGLDEAQAGIKIVGGNINNLRYAGDTTLIAERDLELKNLLMKVKEESENTGLKLNIQKS